MTYKLKWKPNQPIEKLRDEIRANDVGTSVMCNLPSAPIPPDIDTGYPVWAMDNHGYCLVGNTADEIEHVNSIREGQ